MNIEEVHDPDAIRGTVARVLAALPAWFGIPESTQEYVAGAAACPCLVAEDGGVLGFLSYRTTSDCAAEIYVMGVVPEHHRRGVGQRLVDACVSRLASQGIVYLTVKTLADTHPSPEYAHTRAFYLAQGFRPLEVLPDLWGPDTPCLSLLRPIQGAGA